MTESNKKLVFISHASADAKKAGEICSALETLGLGCWIAPRDIDPGKQYGEEIIHGIESTQGLVLVLTRKSNESPHVRDEAERAKHYGKRIIPFRIEDITPSKALEFYIATSQWIDAFGSEWDKGIDLLAGTISKMAGQEPPASPVRPGRRSGRKPVGIIAAACVAVLAVGIGGWALLKRPALSPSSEFAADTAPRVTQETGAADSLNRGVVMPASPKRHPDADGLIPDYHALVIGINKYASYGADGWDSLRSARRDAEEVARILNEKYGFSVTRLLDEQATRANIMAALDNIATGNENDAIMIYYAGHGYYKEDVDQGYWIPADARRKTSDGRPAKEDWVWNSTITEILNSTSAKHVLLVADSCFSGSLFRGATDDDILKHHNQWYRRAISKDSRYLITSGDLEPVLDGGGGGHSVFAKQLLTFLQDHEDGIFSASDLAQAVRQRVSGLTGQLVRMGHLPVASHAGGEFVFLRQDKGLPPAEEPPEGLSPEEALRFRAGPVVEVDQIKSQVPRRSKSDNLKLAMDMFNQGATNASLQYVSSLGDDKIAQAVVAHLTQKSRQESRDRLHRLIEDLEKRKAQADANAAERVGYARPRIVSLLGPGVTQGTYVDPSTEQLIRICLTTELGFSGKLQVVEREALEDIMEEMALGSSAIADDRASIEIGKLLPASLIVMGNLIPSQKDDTVNLYLRLVDTETSGIKGSFRGATGPDMEIADVCREISEKITGIAVRIKPIQARVLKAGADDTIQAAAGSFHGVAFDTEFKLVQRIYPDASKLNDFSEKTVGSASVVELREETCDLQPTFADPQTAPDPANLWIKEKAL